MAEVGSSSRMHRLFFYRYKSFPLSCGGVQRLIKKTMPGICYGSAARYRQTKPPDIFQRAFTSFRGEPRLYNVKHSTKPLITIPSIVRLRKEVDQRSLPLPLRWRTDFSSWLWPAWASSPRPPLLEATPSWCCTTERVSGWVAFALFSCCTGVWRYEALNEPFLLHLPLCSQGYLAGQEMH
jgi:hypothetical protein